MRRLINTIGWISLCLFITAGCSKGQEEGPEIVVASQEEQTVTEAYGSIVANDIEHITIEVPSQVTKVLVNNGQLVQKGDVLFSLDIDAYRKEAVESELTLDFMKTELANMLSEDGVSNKLSDSAMKQLTAEKEELSRLENNYYILKKGYDSGSHEELVQLSKSKEAALIASDKAFLKLDNNKALFESGVISSTELGDSEANALALSLAYDRAVVDYNQTKVRIKNSLGELWYNIGLMRSKVDQLEVNEGNSTLDYQRKALEVQVYERKHLALVDKLNSKYINDQGDVICHIEDGVFSGFDLVVGDYINGDLTTATYTMINSQAIEVSAQISEDFISDISVGAPAIIRPVANREKVYKGQVTYISDMAYDAGGDAVVKVLVSIDDNDGFLKPNYSVDIEITSLD